MDLNKWSFWIGIISLALAFPVSVFANVLTPGIKDFFARRSTLRRRQRIEDLQRQVKYLQCLDYDVRFQQSELILMVFESVALASRTLIYCIVALLTLSSPVLTPNSRLFITLGVLTICGVWHFRIYKYERRIYRAADPVQKSIDKLEARIKALQEDSEKEG